MPDDKLKKKEIHTFADDMAGVIQNSKEGLIKKIIHEQEEIEETEEKEFNPERKQNKLYLALSIILLLVSGGVLAYLIYFGQDFGTVEVNPGLAPVIYIDEIEYRDVAEFTKREVYQSIQEEIEGAEIKKRDILGVYLTEDESIVSLHRFLNLIESHLNPEVYELFDPNFLMGVWQGEEARNFFILTKVRSFSDVFPILKAWEKEMLSDFAPFFGLELSAQTKYLFDKDFEDEIVQNKNARVLRGGDGEVVFMYVFLDDNSIIFTDSEEAVQEVALRLSGSQIRK